MQTFPITGANFPFTITFPLLERAREYPSAYPIGMVAILVFLVVLKVLVQP